MPDRIHAAAERRGRRCAAPDIDPRTRRGEILDIIAAGLARVAAGPAPDMPPQESCGDGLELAEHAALSVVARGPTGERPLAGAGDAGEQHGRRRETTDWGS